MPFGPGRYDAIASYVRDETAAAGVVLIVMGGTKGSGFSAQIPPEMFLTLPTILRDVARQLERDAELPRPAGPLPRRPA